MSAVLPLPPVLSPGYQAAVGLQEQTCHMVSTVSAHVASKTMNDRTVATVNKDLDRGLQSIRNTEKQKKRELYRDRQTGIGACGREV